MREFFGVQKLGKNQGGYFGETIDIRSILRYTEIAARSAGWSAEIFHTHLNFDWMAFHRRSRKSGKSKRVYISAGIHGDEPAGPLAALRLMREDRWPLSLEYFFLPCLNPLGFVLNQRGNAEGVDLNRDYRNPKTVEAARHIAWLERQPQFDLYLCLHEDWESHGFYLYEQNPDGKPSLADKMIESVKPVCPIDMSEIIEERPAQGGIIRPNIVPQERPDWPEALYHITHTARQGYTLEAPSDFPLRTRVDALVAAVNAAVETLAAG